MRKTTEQHQNQYKKRIRSYSAKTLPIRNKRPVSTISYRKQQKQAIPNLFHLASSEAFMKNPKQTIINQQSIINIQEIIKYMKPGSTVTTRQKQDLFNENVQLKKQINRLQEQLGKVRGKLQAKTKEEIQMTRKYEKQFDKEMYWLGNRSHMVSGVKRQYQVMKQQYNKLKKQRNQLKSALLQQKRPQLQIYIQQLQTQNNRLKYKLTEILNSQQKIRQITSQYSNAPHQQIIIDLQNKIKNLEQKYQQKIQQQHLNTEILAERQRKIILLEGLMIQRENKKFHYRRSNVQLEREIKEKKDEIVGLRDKIREFKIKYEDDIGKLRLSMKNEIMALNSEIQNKSKVIQDLEVGSKKLEGVIQKMKLLNADNHSTRSKDHHHHNSNRQQLFKSSITFNLNNQSSTVSQNNAYASNTNPTRQQQLTTSIKMSNYNSRNYNIAEQSQYSQNRSQQIYDRQRRSAGIKYSQDAKKVKKVSRDQIKDIIEIMKYRVIGTETSPGDLKDILGYHQYLNYSGSSKNKSDAQFSDTLSQKWNKQYINLAQVKTALKNQPLSLNNEEAELIGRYIIEDSDQSEYVYYDEGNQQNRQIAKSILKALIGQYKLGQKSVKQSVKEFFNKNGNNLYSALKDLYPAKIISSKNLFKVTQSLQMQLSEQQQEYLIAKLSLTSPNLQSLNYESLFNLPIKKQ